MTYHFERGNKKSRYPNVRLVVQKSIMITKRPYRTMMPINQSASTQSQNQQETVLVSGSSYNRTYHQSEDCRAIDVMNYAVEKPLVAIKGHYRPCKRCVDTADDMD